MTARTVCAEKKSFITPRAFWLCLSRHKDAKESTGIDNIYLLPLFIGLDSARLFVVLLGQLLFDCIPPRETVNVSDNGSGLLFASKFGDVGKRRKSRFSAPSGIEAMKLSFRTSKRMTARF
jgi:hypothetical protein